ncbi:MAG: hypothetical protein KC478_15350 [Bacteriovoracaceae bacterium]|nr:hypothetical protein [Bacteriovoracaceae bacterium]
MDDVKLKELLNKDTEIPKAPRDEWARIVLKADQSKQSKIYKMFAPFFAIGVASLLIAVVFKGQMNTNTYEKQAEVMEFFLEEDYLSTQDQLYAWID